MFQSNRKNMIDTIPAVGEMAKKDPTEKLNQNIGDDIVLSSTTSNRTLNYTCMLNNLQGESPCL